MVAKPNKTYGTPIVYTPSTSASSDSDQDGYIEWCDFELATEKIRCIHKWDKNGDKHQAAHDTLQMIWKGLQCIADKNKDGKVSREEWLTMWSSAVESDSGLPDWQKRYMQFMFDVNDTSGDNLIDRDEYSTVYTSFGITKKECEASFAILAGGADGKISRDKFEQLWTEYVKSNDKTACGNYLFGDPDVN